MNKAVVNDLIPKAYAALIDTGIVKNNTIDKAYRGQISTFGAAVSMGSLLAAVAYFSAKGNASVDRQKLIKAIEHLIGQKDLYQYVADSKGSSECKEAVLNAAIALKLAMNLFELTEKNSSNQSESEKETS